RASMEKEIVGIIGIGNMGLPMTRNLVAAGYTVIAYDHRAEARESAADVGATAVDSAAAVGRQCMTRITMLPGSGAVDSVVRNDGLAEAMMPGSTLIDMSTSVPERTKRLALWLAEREIGMLDAPVSGGVAGAERATLTIMVGGEQDRFARYRPLFAA